MNAYLSLGLAIVAEVVATSALKASDGMSRPGPALLVVVGYGAAFWLLSLTLRSLPVGIVYAVWSGVGIAGIAVIGALLFGERLGVAHALGMGLIIAGVVVLTVVAPQEGGRV